MTNYDAGSFNVPGMVVFAIAMVSILVVVIILAMVSKKKIKMEKAVTVAKLS